MASRRLILKTQAEYSRPGSNGGPKYGHYSELDPTFAAMKEEGDKVIATFWDADNWGSFRELWRRQWPLPDDCPKPEKDVAVSYQHVPVRDGAKVEIKVMKSVKTTGSNSALILRTHGGGWAVGWHETENVENLRAAAIQNVVLVSVDYRLAPEYPYPYPLNDTFDVLKWCKANASSLGVDPEKIILLGGSAGANISICTAMKAKAEGVTGIIAQMLDFPATCHPKLMPKDKYELESYSQNFDASIVDALKMELFLDAHTPDPKPDPYHSPLLAETLIGLPPAFMQVAGYDPLRDEALAFAERLKEDGVPVELHVYRGLPHFFSSMLVNLPQSKDYLLRQEAYLKKLVS